MYINPGCTKFRVRPEDITLNIGRNAPLPVPNMPGKWKAVTHDNTVTWLANWTENINGNHKYVFLAAGSSLKGQSDMQKFEKARELKVNSFKFPFSNLTPNAESRRPHSPKLYERFKIESDGRSSACNRNVFH